MRSRATFPLLLFVALLCMASPKLTRSESSESKVSEMASPPTTESTIQKAADYVKHLVKETILPSNPDAYNELMEGVSPAGEPGTSPAANDSNATTTGIVTKLEDLLNPLAQALYLFIDSLLRAFKHKALPCLITSWIPLEATCTPLENSPVSNQPIPAPSGPQPTR
ncbi:hypothetical protein TSAR_011776 [Trichomalopsis sarcophagae]|uniref:Uncharacterized protein n=1 Tax=Trichomalopsis sarcophagae TaxID=543379 RepID=A0A232F6M2_9HYME|nr:hypothetical protein TSAR_011776 [Trichomalopsis sarcophagae]